MSCRRGIRQLSFREGVNSCCYVMASCAFLVDGVRYCGWGNVEGRMYAGVIDF